MKVLIGLDASIYSLPIMDVLKMRVWPEGTVTRLVSVVEPAASKFFNWAADHSSFIHDREKEAAEANLANSANAIAKSVPELAVETKLLRGYAKESLLDEASEWCPDLVIVGSRGTRGVDPLLLGSVSQAILEHSPCPVLVARGTSEKTSGFVDVLLALDHSSYSKAAAEHLLKLKWTKPLKLHIVSVVPAMPANYANEFSVERAAKLLAEYEAMERSALHVLHDWKDRFNTVIGPGTACIELMYGDARDAILSAAEKLSAELIVMGSHGHTGLTRFLLGSVSRSVSANAVCSVEVVHS